MDDRNELAGVPDYSVNDPSTYSYVRLCRSLKLTEVVLN
jgi:hypothetical protein